MRFDTFRHVLNIVNPTRPPLNPPPNRTLTRTETTMLVEQVHGHNADKPTILGEPNGEPAIQVYATGLYEGIKKGVTRWVTGDKVASGLRLGVIVEISDIDPEEQITVERVAQLDRAGERDHVVSPPGAMFEPNLTTSTGFDSVVVQAPVPTSTDADRKLAELGKGELYAIAQQADLPGRSAMDKGELYDHLRRLPNIGDYLD